MKIRIPYYLMPLLAIAGTSCSSDNQEPEIANSVRTAWVSVNLTTGTRALDAIDDAADPSSLINSVNVYFTDENDVIKAVGVGSMNSKKFVDENNTVLNLLAAVDASSPLQEGESYRLRVVANAAMLNPLSSAAIKGTATAHKDLKWSYSATSFNRTASNGLPQNGMPMSTLGNDYAVVKIEQGKGTVDEPFETDKNIELTRMMGAIDYNPQKADNVYDVANHDLKVKFLTIQPVNVASDTYLLQRTSSTVAGLVQTPSQGSWLSQTPISVSAIPLAGLQNVSAPAYAMSTGSATDTRICYITENVPDKSSLTIGKCTGVIFTAQVNATADTPANIASYFSGTKHPDLAYFDDGTYQSGLMEFDAAKHTDGNWHLVKWETLKVGAANVSGYMVRYFKPIRHGGITSDSLDANGVVSAPAGASDGKYDDMEYGVVRGFRYVLRIAGVKSLPHTFNPNDKPEDGLGDLDVRVQVPDSWNYHRRVEHLSNLDK